MSKRAAEPIEDEATPTKQSMPALEGAGPGGSGTSAGASSGSGGYGSHIFHPKRPLKLENKGHLTFTKKFLFKIYANDWLVTGAAGSQVGVIGYMTNIPYQPICMYISPDEWIDIVRNYAYARITNAEFQLEFKAVRTPFDANTSDAAEANGNLQFEIKRWDGLEHMLPFANVDVAPNGSVSLTTTNQELITRLYGTSFATNSIDVSTQRWPATMEERGLSWRPIWNFNVSGNPTAPPEAIYRNINGYISCLPVHEYCTDSINSNVSKMGEGYAFTKVYKPKNGLITMASSAYNHSSDVIPSVDFRTRINTKIRMADQDTAPTYNTSPQYIAMYPQIGSGGTVDAYTGNTQTRLTIPDVTTANATNPVTITTCPGGSVPCSNTTSNFNGYFTGATAAQPIDTINFTTTPVPVAATNVLDNFGFGYNNWMAYYAVANLENVNMFTSNHDPPIHSMPSMMIGAVPKTTKDFKIVNATLEFECTTRITIETSHVHPTYINMAWNPTTENGATIGFQDPKFQTDPNGIQTVAGGRWIHNEKDVALNDNNKYWSHSYGLAAKPLFGNLPANTPMIAKPLREVSKLARKRDVNANKKAA